MSSMFKKKGGLGFKPKLPTARPRAVPIPSSQSAKPPTTQASIDSQSQSVATGSSKPTVNESPSTEHHETIAEKPQESTRQRSPTPPQPSTSSETPQPSSQIPETGNVTEKESGADTSEASVVAPLLIQQESSISKPTPVTKKPRQPVPTSARAKIAPDSTREDINNAPAIAKSIEEDQVEAETTSPADSATPVSSPEGAPPSPPLSQSTAPAVSSNETTAPPKPRTRRKSAKVTQDEAGDEEEAARPKKRQRKAPQDGDSTAPKKTPRKRKSPVQSEGDSEPQSQPRRRRARSLTPEDSESQLVDLQKLKMSDLTKDLHIGRKFSRHDELRERERRKRSKSKTGDHTEGEGSATPEPKQQASKEGSTPAPSGPAPTSGPQFRIVDGQIVVDQSSLVMDRHARDKAAQGDMEIVEENDFTRLITSNSFMTTSKLRGPNIWTDEETELFYRALRMFGTDFEMISKMFQGKQRRHVKLKYNREERHNPERITAAVVGEKTIKMDIDEYKAITGSEFESVEVIEAEQRKMEEEFETERQRVADEQAEIMRQKREELFADDDEDGKKKKKGKKKKQTIVYGLNGEPITTTEE